MVITHLKPGTEEEAAKEGKLGLQQYPGPLKYSYMHSFLSTFAGMLGCVRLTISTLSRSTMSFTCCQCMEIRSFSSPGDPCNNWY